MTSTPASWTSQSNWTPVASSARRAASMISGPVPSPGMNVTLWATRPSPSLSEPDRAERLAVEQGRDRQDLVGVVLDRRDQLDDHRRHGVEGAALALDDLGAAEAGGGDDLVDRRLRVAGELLERDAGHTR